ncbi:MAG: glycosyltransferase [Solirubrobacterales bacterium]
MSTGQAAIPRVTVVVPCHRSARHLDRLLDGLAQQTLTTEEFEVVLVDDGLDDTPQLVGRHQDRWGHRLRLYQTGEQAPGAKRNLGAGLGHGSVLAFTDPDCRPEPAWLAAGLAEIDAGSDVVQGRTLPEPGERPHPFGHCVVVERPSPLYEACNVFYERSAFERAGGFPPGGAKLAGDHFGEDCELAWAVRRQGGQAAFAPVALVRHAVFPPDFRRHLRAQWKGRLFAYLLVRVPELRRELLVGRVFLGSDSVARTAAAIGVAAMSRDRRAVVLALPWLARPARHVPWRAGPRVAAQGLIKHLAADAVRGIALAWGSIRFGRPVL